MWEERNVEGVIEKTVEWLDVASIYIDGVGEGLESEERYTYRKEDVEVLPVGHYQRAKEVGVFEVGKKREVDEEGEEDEPGAFAGFGARRRFVENRGWLVGFGYCLGYVEVGDGDYCKEDEVDATALVVEIVGEESDEYDACRVCLVKEAVDEAEP